MLENKKAILFDLDGTFVDSMWMWEAIDIEYLARFGKEYTPDLQRAIDGMSIHETAVYFKERYQIPDSIEKMQEDWNEMARLGVDKTYGLEWNDGVVLMKCRTVDDAIAPYFFADCISLRRIALPKKLKKVDRLAFFECKGLIEVTNLPKDVHTEAFLSSSYQK